MVLFSTIGGAVAFFQYLASTDNYELSFYLKSSNIVIENDTGLSELQIQFKGEAIQSLYASKFILKNTGNKAITKDFIYEPLVIALGDGKILKIESSNKLTKLKNNSVIFQWDLLNPGDEIILTALTTSPVTISAHHRIKEITSILIINELTNPPPKKKLESVSIAFPIIMLISILAFIDSIIVVRWDGKLGRIFGLTKSLFDLNEVDKNAYLNELNELYVDYYNSPFLLLPINPSELLEHVKEGLPQENILKGRAIEVLRLNTLNYVRHANLYSGRSVNIFIAPLVFGFCLIRIAIAIIF